MMGSSLLIRGWRLSALFFIVGSPRSGTTLLQAMLSRSDRVAVPPETQMMAVTYARRRKLGPIHTARGWERAVNAVVHRNLVAGFPVAGDALRGRLDGPGERSYRRIILDWLGLVAEGEGVDVIGEKSPAHTKYVPLLARMIPEARFIHIVRDPRDVALSQNEVWGRSSVEAAMRWRFDVNTVRSASRAFGDRRVRTVQYEDLVREPASILRDVAGFLGTEFTPEMCEPSGREKAGFAPREEHKLMTLEAVTTDRIARYTSRLSRSDRRIVELVCGRSMRGFGYEVSEGGVSRGVLDAITILPSIIGSRLRRRRALEGRLSAAASGSNQVERR